MEILAHGKIDEDNLEDVVKVLSLDHNKGFVSTVPHISHWWSLLIAGEKHIYFGTVESFEKWRRERIN